MRMDVWLEAHETRVGVLERAEDKALTFTYDPGITDSGRISLSLPVREAPYSDAACRGYFENLLFEGTQLNRVLDSHRIDRGDVGALLFHMGADCPGAISITPEATGPGKRPGIFPDDYDLLSPENLLTVVHSLHLENKLPDENRYPSPLAGVQGKIAVVFKDGQYWLPKSKTTAPTTHILKVSPGNDASLTSHECALLAMAGACDLNTTKFEAKTFQVDDLTINAILVNRFDRDIRKNAIHRIHAEDFCQALGLAPSLKYERKSDSPDHKFSATAVGSIAAKVSAPGLFLQQFFGQTLFNMMVGNSDNHGKNGCLLYRGQGVGLAPLYDVVPVFMDPHVTHQFAFDIGTARFAEDVTQDDILTMMTQLGYRRPRFDKRLDTQLRLIIRAVTDVSEVQGGKRLADGLAAQMSVVADALKLDLGVPERDYFERSSRDEKSLAGGWVVTS